jgi:hypothetical protein
MRFVATIDLQREPIQFQCVELTSKSTVQNFFPNDRTIVQNYKLTISPNIWFSPSSRRVFLSSFVLLPVVKDVHRGSPMGLADGTAATRNDGAVVVKDEDTADGTADSAADGTVPGLVDGASVGAEEDPTDEGTAMPEGAADGTALGLVDGAEEGPTTGLFVGDADGSGVLGAVVVTSRQEFKESLLPSSFVPVTRGAISFQSRVRSFRLVLRPAISSRSCATSD